MTPRMFVRALSLSLLLASPRCLEGQVFAPWSIVAGLGITDGGDYNARGAFVGGIAYETSRSGAASPYFALGVASVGELNADCVSYSGNCFRHFPGWTSLTGGIAMRANHNRVATRIRAGIGLVGYQERDPSPTGENAQGGLTAGAELGSEMAMARAAGQAAPMISLRGMLFRGPRNSMLRVYSAGLGVRF